MTDSHNPLVSAVIPTYNRPNVKEAVRSALNQTYDNIEVIVVDDHSQTPAEEILEDLEDERLRIFRHESNKNGSAARNTGIENAKGKYIAFLDDDDRWKEEKIEKQLEKLNEYGKEYRASYTSAENSYGDRKEVLNAIYEGDITENLLLMNVDGSFGSTLLVEKEVAEEVNGFDEEFGRHQDWEFLLRILKHTKICCVQEPLLIRNHDGNLTDTEKLLKNKKRYLRKFRVEIEGTGVLTSRKIYSKHYLQIAKNAIRSENFLLGGKFYIKSLLKYPFLNPKEIAKPPYYFSRMVTIGLNDE